MTLEKMTESLSVLSDLAEHADQTKGLGATLHEPTVTWSAMRTANTLANTTSTWHIGSELTGGEVGGFFSGKKGLGNGGKKSKSLCAIM